MLKTIIIIDNFLLKEVIVWPEELRGIPESDPTLKEKYAKFNDEVNAQEARVEEIIKVADLMIANKHPDEMIIRQRREVINCCVLRF